MFHLPHYEVLAIDAAGVQAGAYLDTIGKTDLAAFSPEEWRQLIALIFLTATAELRTLVEKDAPS